MSIKTEALAAIDFARQTFDRTSGVLEENRWRLDFPAMAEETSRVQTLAEARRRLDEAWQRMRQVVSDLPESKLQELMPDNPILANRPRYHALEGLTDHTAHHRGSLAVCARLLGKVPPMPYAD